MSGPRYKNITFGYESLDEYHKNDEKFRNLYMNSPVALFNWKKEGSDFHLFEYNYEAMSLLNEDIRASIGIQAAEFFQEVPLMLDWLEQTFSTRRGLTLNIQMKLGNMENEELFTVIFKLVEPDFIQFCLFRCDEHSSAGPDRFFPGTGSLDRPTVGDETKGDISDKHKIIAFKEPRSDSFKADCTESILLVEDDPILNKITLKMLGNKGYKVHSSFSGEEAIDLCESFEPPIELLITDVVLPGMDGFSLAQKIIQIFPEIEILFTSGYGEKGVVIPYFTKEVYFLEKPYDPSDLFKKIRKIID